MAYRMRTWIPVSATLVILATAALNSGQTPARTGPQIPRMPDGKPNFTGLWEALGTADWDIRDHSSAAGPFFQLGAEGAMPAGEGIVEGGEIPYTPAAAAQQKENQKNRMKLDPEIKCYMPGIPRANYMPFPFQIVQSQRDIAFAYEYATSNRVVNMGKFKEGSVDTWMGTSNGHWEGDTLVVDTTGFKRWGLDDYFYTNPNEYRMHSDALTVTERISWKDAKTLNYGMTLDDPKIFTKAWSQDFTMTLHPDWDQMGIFEYVCEENNRCPGGKCGK